MVSDSFFGTGWDFPPTFLKGKNGVLMTSDQEDIEKSLHILLTTGIGERIMQPRYGCNMDRLLFEPLDTTMQAYMEDIVRTAVLYFEPRIILNSVVLVPLTQEGRIDIMVDYLIAGTNSRYNFVYPYFLDEGASDKP
ncbi:MAG: GPW/gp25 family protein [Saprospiraceae bacterium]|nr:GPW/gp25 family protein [Saprospiraceae bacterium]